MLLDYIYIYIFCSFLWGKQYKGRSAFFFHFFTFPLVFIFTSKNISLGSSMQRVVSYVVSNLAQIADIDPENVVSSLRERKLSIRHMKLRRDTLNALLPISFDSGSIGELQVEIPWPTSNQPLKVIIKEIKITLNQNINDHDHRLTLDDIRHGITEESILGTAISGVVEEAMDLINTNTDLEATLPTDEMEIESIESFLPSSATSEVDDDDYLSCRSESDVSLNSSISGSSDETVPTATDSSGGIFSFFRNAASQSLSWVMNRRVEVWIEDVKILIPCDLNNEANLTLNIKELSIQMEPIKVVGSERMRIISINLTGIFFSSYIVGVTKNFIELNSLCVRMTSVFGAKDKLLRKNTAVELNGVSSFFLDENSLQNITQCIGSYHSIRQLPKYCRPFYTLRRQNAWWPYTLHCVLENVRERRRRFNFNPSHLNFFAEARNTYIRLLDYCHRMKDVSEKRESLAVIENDLLYRDVVMFLRAHVQEKYAAQPAPSWLSNAKPVQVISEANSPIVDSLHIDMKIVRLCFPASSVVWVRDIAFVSRFEEKKFSIGSITIESDGKVQALRGVRGLESFLSIELEEKHTMNFLKFQMGETRLVLRSLLLLQVLKPFADMTFHVVPIILQYTQKASHSSSMETSKSPYTISLAFPLVSVLLDDVCFTTEKLSLSYIEYNKDTVRFGVLLKEFSVRHGHGGLVVEPVSIEMTDNDDITLSEFVINISDNLWEYICELREQWRDVASRLQKTFAVDNTTISPTKTSAPTPMAMKTSSLPVSEVKNAKMVNLEQMDEVTRMLLKIRVVPKSQQLCINGLKCNFHPLEICIEMGHLTLSHVFYCTNMKAKSLIVSSFLLSSKCNDEASISLQFSTSFTCLIRAGTESKDPGLILSFDTLEAIWMSSLPLSLVHVTQVQVVVSGDTTSVSAQTITTLDAVSITPFKMMYRSCPACPPTSRRPYPASYMQLYVNLTSFRVDRLANVTLNALFPLMSRYTTFLVEQIVSVEAYRLFFSGLTDIAIRLNAASCEIFFSESDKLLLNFDMPYIPAAEKSLMCFGSILPEVREVSSLLIINDVDALCVKIGAPNLQMELLHSNMSNSTIGVKLQSLLITTPMEIQEFWEPEVRMVEPIPLEMVFQNAMLCINRDLFVLEVDNFVFSQSTPSIPSRDGSSGVGAFSDNELGSDASSVNNNEEHAQLEVGGWDVRIKTPRDAATFTELFLFYAELRHMFYSTFQKHIVTCAFLENNQFHLNHTGPLFFDLPDKVILVEGCTFLTNMEEVKMVVCSRTSVCFRHCHFSPLLRQMILGEDESAVFVFEDCSEIGLDAKCEILPVVQERQRRPVKRVSFSLQGGKVNVALNSFYKLLFSFPLIDIHLTRSSRRDIVRLRVQRYRCDVFEDAVVHQILTRTDTDVDYCINHKNGHATLNAAVRSGSVSIPLSIVCSVRSLVHAWQCGLSQFKSSKRCYYIPGTRHQKLDLPFPQWKIFVTASIIPLEIRLPNGIPFVRCMLANSAIWSKREVSTDAFVEVRMGLQEISIWEFSSQAYASLLRKSLTAVLVARIPDLAAVSCDFSVSSSDFSVSSEQIRCILSLCTSLQASNECLVETDGALQCAVDLTNLCGVPILLQCSNSEDLMLSNHLVLYRKTLTTPQCLKTVAGQGVDHFENSSFVFPECAPQLNELLQTAHTAVLDSGETIHVVTRIEAGTLTKFVTFRSTFHVLNLLQCVMMLRMPANNEVIMTLQPGELSCVPLAYMDMSDMHVALESDNSYGASSGEPLCEGSPRNLIKTAQARGEESMGRLKVFAFIGTEKAAHVDVTYRLVGSVLTTIFASATPAIHNGTRFPLKVLLFAEENLVDEAIVEPDAVFENFFNDPFGPRLQFLFGCIIYEDVFLADEKVDVKNIDPIDGESMVMKHHEHPRRFFFELSVARSHSALRGPHVLYSVQPRYVFGIENNSGLDVEITSYSGNSVGSLGNNFLFSTPGKNFAYLPLNTSIILQVGTTKSVPFDVKEKSLEERLLVCNNTDSSTDMRCCHCFILRPHKGTKDKECVMELVPAAYFVNLGSEYSLLIKHTVGRNDDDDDDDDGNIMDIEKKDLDWTHNVVVAPNDVLPYTLLSSYGHKDFFAFACSSDAEENPSYSTFIEAALTPETDWTGFIQCGETHHAVRIRKNSICDPATITISAPRSPYVKLVNLTSQQYGALGSMEAFSYTPPSINSNEVLLSLGGSKYFTIPLGKKTYTELDDGIFVFLCGQGDGVTVVLTHASAQCAPFNLLHKSFDGSLPIEQDGETFDLLFGSFRVDFKSSGFHFTVRDSGEYPIKLSVETAAIWLVYQSRKFTVQCAVSNACVQNTYNGKNHYIIKPFCFDAAVRDLQLMTNAVRILAVQINLTRLELEFSDIFMYQLQKLSTHCQARFPQTEPGSRQISALIIDTSFNPKRNFEVLSCTIFEVCVVLTWDRSIVPPEDVVFHGSTIGNLIPSLPRATMTLPTLRLRDLCGNSAIQMIGMIKEVLLVEVIKRIPNLVSSVVFFPSLAPLGGVLSRVGSLIFGTRSSSSDLSGTTLI